MPATLPILLSYPNTLYNRRDSRNREPTIIGHHTNMHKHTMKVVSHLLVVQTMYYVGVHKGYMPGWEYSKKLQEAQKEHLPPLEYCLSATSAFVRPAPHHQQADLPQQPEKQECHYDEKDKSLYHAYHSLSDKTIMPHHAH